MPSIKSVALNAKQYAMVAAGGLGLTGGRAPSGPLNAQIGISDPCNHKCVFCWDHPDDIHESADTDWDVRFGHSRPGVMTFEIFKGIVDDLWKLGTRRIDLIGRGEPFNNRSAMKMIRYAKSRDMHIQLCSNGSRITESIAKDLVAVGANRLNVSLNAGTPETYPRIHVTESPEKYLRVKRNLRFLSDTKIAAGSDVPFISLSFVINSRNYFEIEKMVDAAREVGAQEAQFAHLVPHDGIHDLELSHSQFEELQGLWPGALEKAVAGHIRNNLQSFGVSIPTYMPSEMVGSPVVPCYVGWYMTVLLGNGNVLPCCQCSKPLGQVTNERPFSEIWAGQEYSDFRIAAKSLPEKSDRLMTCECDNCQQRPRNLAIHNFLHPLNRMPAGKEVQRFTPNDLVKKMFGIRGLQEETAQPPSVVLRAELKDGEKKRADADAP
jgi:MoaA/NifB/PqqE/SkfB family radical SAM enzyme